MAANRRLRRANSSSKTEQIASEERKDRASRTDKPYVFPRSFVTHFYGRKTWEDMLKIDLKWAKISGSILDSFYHDQP